MKKKSYLVLIMIISMTIIVNYSIGQMKNEDSVQLSKNIDKYVLGLIKKNEPGGVVMVVKNGNILFKKGYGMANMELGISMESSMVFNIGSLTKQFTAIATMMLIENGELFLEDDIVKYIPDFPVNKHKVLIKHLLSHTSGIQDYINIKEFYDNIREDLTSEDVIEIIKKAPHNNNPGDKFDYSNSNYALLGTIIRKVSGIEYDQFVTENIIKPLQLRNTQFINNEEIIHGLVNGYERINNKMRKARMMSWSYLYADGGLCTNVDDLAKWNKAVFNNDLINPVSLTQCLTAQQLNNGITTKMGFGWFIEKLYNKKYLYHGGGIFGYVNHTLYLPEEEIYVVVLKNYINPSTDTKALAEAIVGIVLGIEIPSVNQNTFILSQAKLKKYIGEYQFEDSSIRKIMLIETKLYYGTSPDRKIEIFAESNKKFFTKDKKLVIEFIFNESNEVTGIISSVQDKSKKGTKR